MPIWKYPLQVTDRQVIRMPKDARVLCLKTQNETPCVWAHVQADAEMDNRVFMTVGTGNAMPEVLDTDVYLGSYMLHGGALVFHVFERPF